MTKIVELIYKYCTAVLINMARGREKMVIRNEQVNYKRISSQE